MAHEVGLNIGAGVFETVANARLRTEMGNAVEFDGVSEVFERVEVRKSPRSRRARDVAAPMNPAAPVTSTAMADP
jgi:hypothetical protein